MQDEVEKPGHYQFGQMEAWDIIELAVMDIADPVTAYHVASALKYLLRAARKGGNTDIAKASAHLKREVARHAVRIPPPPEYDPADVAFRCGDLGWLGEAAVSEVCASCGLGDVPEKVLAPTAAELAAADGVSEYGNPITPGCAVPTPDDNAHGVFDIDLTRAASFFTTDGVYHVHATPWRLP